MLSDIEIAQGCQMRPITEVAAAAGLDADDLELYGKYKAKLSADVWTKVKDKENGKLVLVTAINPTPAGEGKTTTSVGLGQALCKQGKNAIIALREPSLGPVFGIKGGAAGGGYAQVVPTRWHSWLTKGSFSPAFEVRLCRTKASSNCFADWTA